jgi:hypothetical protein
MAESEPEGSLAGNREEPFRTISPLPPAGSGDNDLAGGAVSSRARARVSGRSGTNGQHVRGEGSRGIS